MTKLETYNLFGSITATASALGITRMTLYNWPDVLTTGQHDRVVGAFMRVKDVKYEIVMASLAKR